MKNHYKNLKKILKHNSQISYKDSIKKHDNLEYDWEAEKDEEFDDLHHWSTNFGDESFNVIATIYGNDYAEFEVFNNGVVDIIGFPMKNKQIVKIMQQMEKKYNKHYKHN